MKKVYSAPQMSGANTRIRASILAGSIIPGNTPTDLNGVRDYDPEKDGGLGARRRTMPGM